MRIPGRACFIVLMTFLVLGFVTPPRPASACELCKYNIFLGYSPCRPVGPDEVGSTVCTDSYDPLGGFSCEESGTFCSSITAGGGGGAGGAGGDGSACHTSGFCPAQCFSCSGGGGGRPAI
jgi:hypothetical protein